jgi:Ca2+-binding RTX toxin-like protein
VCTSVTNFAANDEMLLAIGTDDKVVVAPVGGVWNISINGGALAPCVATATVAAVKWINVTGSDAGAETVTFYNPAVSFSAINTTVNLGNGIDTVVFDYAAISAPVLPDTGVGASLGFGVAGDGSVNGGSPTGGPQFSDFRITGPESIIVNGSNSLVSGDTLNLSDLLQAGITAAGPIAGTADDTLSTLAPVATGVTFNAGAGDDTMVSGNGADNFQGGAGVDAVSYAGSSVGVTADLTAATGTGQGNDTLADVQNIVGSPFNDKLTGNLLNNVINGGAGDDIIDGGAGNDILSGDAGDDTINEGAANNGTDMLFGGTTLGVDVAGIGALGDTINYGARTTDIVIKAGGGAVSGASGELDTVDTTFENYITGTGNDTLVGSSLGFQTFTPGSGANNVNAGSGPSDYLDMSDQTGPAAFVLSLGAGTGTSGTTVDTFSNMEAFIGTPGDDTLKWDGTSLTPASAESREIVDFIGGDGVDTIDASAATVAVEIDMSEFTGSSLENANGGTGADEIVGNASGNVLQGNDGNDAINGMGGNDTIVGGAGNDSLDTLPGNTGADTLKFTDASTHENVDNQLGFATGGDGQDSIGFFAIIWGTSGKDTVRAGQNAFSVNQRLYGQGGNDRLFGSNSSDLLVGGDGNDSIYAGAGDDVLAGKAGNDFLVGGTGFDVGNGGPGTDTCIQIERMNSCEKHHR